MTLATSDLNQQTHLTRHRCLHSDVELQHVTMIPEKSQAAELKNGRIIFRQKPILFDSHSETMQEIVTFRGLLETSNLPLTTIPEEHFPLIAKLVHESDKSLNALVKSLQSSLVNPLLESSPNYEAMKASDFLPTSALEHAINTVATRNNYGISTNVDKLPAALCVWRWEVKNTDWLPKSASEKVTARFLERLAAKKHLQTTFDDLTADVKESILKTVKQGKAVKWKEVAIGPLVKDKQTSQTPVHEQGAEDVEDSMKKPSRPKRLDDPKVIAKEQEKQERRAVKVERERKAAEETKRSAAVFANFFKPAATQPQKHSRDQNLATAEASSSDFCSPQVLNEFQTTFKSFVLKKDSQLAPINWFINEQKKEAQSSGKHAMGGANMHSRGASVFNGDVSTLSPKELLRSFLDTEILSLPSRTHRISSFKARPAHVVRNIMDELTEAEVTRDQRTMRRLTALLQNRRKLPVKVFIFAENNRPGYLGTWTRSSSVINPRKPFTRDLLSLDYDYDSDAEWEEDVDDAEDVESVDGSIEDEEEVSPEMDDWLVDGDEVDEVPVHTPPHPTSSGNKRKTSDGREPPTKKRKVVPLIPFYRGPVWEKEIGGCEYQPFESMRIRLFNDTPFPIDPFTFVSSVVGPDKTTELPFVESSTSTEGSRGAKPKPAHVQAPPKTVFPDELVPHLLQKINESNTNSFAVLLDSSFQDMKSLGVRKNALEVKLREVADKDKETKGWVVKDDAWIKHGLVKPTR